MTINLNADQLKNIIILVVTGKFYNSIFFSNFEFLNEAGEEIRVEKEEEQWVVKIGGEVVASRSWVAEGWGNEETKEVLSLQKKRNELSEAAEVSNCSFKKCLLGLLSYSSEGCYSWKKDIDCGSFYTTIKWHYQWEHILIVREAKVNGKFKEMAALSVSKKGVEIFPFFENDYQVKVLKSFLEGELLPIFTLLKKEKELNKQLDKVQIELDDFIETFYEKGAA